MSNFWMLVVIQQLEAARGISVLTHFIPDYGMTMNTVSLIMSDGKLG